jgi:hypothetical protein
MIDHVVWILPEYWAERRASVKSRDVASAVTFPVDFACSKRAYNLCVFQHQ